MHGATGMKDLSRRMFLGSAAAVTVLPLCAASRREAHRFRTTDFDIEMTVEYHDGYHSRGFWFRHGESRHFCLSAGGDENRACVAGFRGSLAIAQYRIRPRDQARTALFMREYVRTVDRDLRLVDRPPYERTIELKSGVGSDLQAFGYESLGAVEESTLGLRGPWYLFRQDLFLEPRSGPFLTVLWKHAFSSIRSLDIIPGEKTWPA